MPLNDRNMTESILISNMWLIINMKELMITYLLSFKIVWDIPLYPEFDLFIVTYQ